MFTAEYKGINSFLVGASKLLLDEGVKRTTRGYTCWELPAPFMFKISDPTSRIVTIPQRKWNSALPFAESLWIALGINDLDFIGHYLKNMQNFSDDGVYLRGGYGPRIRKYNATTDDYRSSRNNHQNKSDVAVDQLRFVIDLLLKDINTRQAIITIGDPNKDCFMPDGNLKNTKDFPCTRSIHFQKHPTENKLNMTVTMRSNDIMWGASAVNIFNFTFIQEYVSHLVGLEIGEYYQIVSNFHFYDNFKSVIEDIAKVKNTIDIGYNYKKCFRSLADFDKNINILSDKELLLRASDNVAKYNFDDDFFNDWFNVFVHFNTKNPVHFVNPILKELYNKL